MPRVVIFGNSGSGKSTAAVGLARELGAVHLDLDTIAWQPGTPVRRPLADSLRDLSAALDAAPDWVVEGCYADLVAEAARRCTRLVFLNPGVEVCLAHARRRPWEPHKYATREAQDANLPMLLDWIRAYETRDDVFSLRAHRRLFDEFRGDKLEVTDPTQPWRP